jgi:hypothetical protein
MQVLSILKNSANIELVKAFFYFITQTFNAYIRSLDEYPIAAK